MNTIPKYLLELVDSTPAGFQKLIACWAHLSCESQLILFEQVKNMTCLNHLRKDFYYFILKEEKMITLNI